MKKLFTLTFFTFFLFTLQAQKLDHVLGDVIISVKPDANVHKLIRRLQTWKGVPTRLEVKREVSRPMRAWLLSFDFAKINENEFLNELWRQPEVEIAQVNHLIQMRDTVPNDPNFDSQWQWLNTGQSGGTIDADVDAELAWDITTGGNTATGDSIVVCVLEGTNRNHPDLQGNLWFNYNEIPDNGIDDDNNGYVDDYRGWNIVTDNDNIPAEGHGTTVSGMIGAKGNNGVLVSGINWNVKIMNVEFNGITEANVLESYTYPWVMRKLYNETNGAKGAFIVATNASWGLDNADPASAPLWCAFYDSLGMVGVLNCGATANNNVNIDVVGDLPTGCSSEFMVAVTATNRNDVRTFSGYGVESIDIGAPGASVVSLTLNGGPSNSSGTSFASPLTAGLIALLYSAPCSSIGSLAKADPAGTALKIRDAIFEGVDKKTNLTNEVKYGGRVNAFNSLQIILDNCSPCPQPFNIALTELIDTSAALSWTSTDSTVQTNLRWRMVGDTVWTKQDSVFSPVNFTGLLSCTLYEFQLIDLCADSTDGYTIPFVFKTDGCCQAPKDLVLKGLSDTSVTATWNNVLAANTYNLLLITPLGNEVFEGLTNTTLTLTLEPCTEYGIQIQTVCDTGVTDYGTLIEFKTLGCGSCTDLIYCEAKSQDANEEWIANVTINTLNNTSVSNGGYGDFTGESTDLMTYKAYPISLTPGYLAGAFNDWFSVWIDFNQDGDFNDSGEEVYDAGSTTQTTVNGSVIIPPNATPGLTRMRVIMRWNAEPGPCDFNYNFGEVEDYCVNIVAGTPPDCLAPDDLAATNIGFTNATLHWDGTADAITYSLRFRIIGAPSWTVISANGSVLLQGLAACTEHEFQVRSNCIGVESPWSGSVVFTTNCFPPCDDVPGGLDTSAVLFNTATLHWNSTANAQNYRIRYKKVTASNWIVATFTQTSFNLINLEGCTDYHFTVQALCPGGIESDFGPLFPFKTDCMTALHETGGSLQSLTVQPNPFSSSFRLAFSLKKSSDVLLELYDARGQRIFTSNAPFAAGENEWLPDADRDGFGELPQGVYFIKMTVDNGYGVRKIVKN